MNLRKTYLPKTYHDAVVKWRDTFLPDYAFLIDNWDRFFPKDRTFELCAGSTDVVWRRWGRIRVHGKEAPQVVYEALDAEALAGRRFLPLFEDGLEAFERRKFPDARALFARAAAERPGGDGPSRFYVDWCDRLLAQGFSDDWQPVLETRK